MKTNMIMTHIQMLENLFSELDKRLSNRHGKSVLKGFWQSGESENGFCSMHDGSIESQRIRHMGFWKASMQTPYGPIDLLVAIMGGDTRIGVSLPVSFVYGQAESVEFISKLYDGNPAPIQRQIGVNRLYDWRLTEAPFSAEWFLLCTKDQSAYDILENHFLWLVIHFVEGVQRTVHACLSEETPIIGNRYLTSDEAEENGLTISSCFDVTMESGLKKVTMIHSSHEKINENFLESITKIVNE